MKRLIILLLFASPLLAQDQIIDRYFPCGISDSTVWIFEPPSEFHRDKVIIAKDEWWWLSSWPPPYKDKAIFHYFPYQISDNKISYSRYTDYGEYHYTIAEFTKKQGERFECYFSLVGDPGASPPTKEIDYGKCISTDTTVVTKFDTLKHCYLFGSPACLGPSWMRGIFGADSSYSGSLIYYAPGIGFASPYLTYAKIGSKEYGKLPDGITQGDLVNLLTSVPNVKEQIPESFTLAQNYPNPFNSETVIEFNLPQFSEINLAVYDVSGREIKTILSGQLPPGTYSEKWNGTDNSGNAVASGVYFIRLKSGQYSKFIKAVYSK